MTAAVSAGSALLTIVEDIAGTPVILWQAIVAVGGPIDSLFEPPLQAGPGKTVSAVLAAAGAANIGTVAIQTYIF